MAAGKKFTYPYIRYTLQNKVNAYKTLMAQTTGTPSRNRPTPTQINTFAKWIDKGAVLHNVTNAQLNRWAGKTKTWTTGSAKSTLVSKYGKNAIKFVAPNKTGGWLVATPSTYRGKPFKFSY
jgi:hypothetical protein